MNKKVIILAICAAFILFLFGCRESDAPETTGESSMPASQEEDSTQIKEISMKPDVKRTGSGKLYIGGRIVRRPVCKCGQRNSFKCCA